MKISTLITKLQKYPQEYVVNTYDAYLVVTDTDERDRKEFEWIDTSDDD
jgi:hypothetical protein